MDKESPEERLSKVEIKPVERECLERVFEYLRNKPNLNYKIFIQRKLNQLQVLEQLIRVKNLR